jgi:hypothetical protein
MLLLFFGFEEKLFYAKDLIPLIVRGPQNMGENPGSWRLTHFAFFGFSRYIDRITFHLLGMVENDLNDSSEGTSSEKALRVLS